MAGNFKSAERRFSPSLVAFAMVIRNTLHSIVYYGAAASFENRAEIKRMGMRMESSTTIAFMGFDDVPPSSSDHITQHFITRAYNRHK